MVTITDDDISQEYPGISKEVLERLANAIEQTAFWERERSRVQADVDEAVSAAKAPFAEHMAEIEAGMEEARSVVIDLYVNEVLAKANDSHDVITMKLRSGRLELRRGPEALIYDDEKKLETWARRQRVLKATAKQTWVFSKTRIKALLKKRPELLVSLTRNGVAHLEYSQTLAIKPEHVQVELTEKIAPLRVKL